MYCQIGGGIIVSVEPWLSGLSGLSGAVWLLSGAVGAAALRHFRRAMNHKITPSEELADRALEISLDLRLSPPLCLYFALAERQEADLVTAFQPFHEAVRGTAYAGMVTDLRSFL